MEIGCNSCRKLLSNCWTVLKGVSYLVTPTGPTFRGIASSHLLRQHVWISKNFNRALITRSTILPLHRQIHKDNVTRSVESYDTDEGFFSRILRKFGKMQYSEGKLRFGGFLLYEKCADGVDYNVLMKRFNLPDTYNTWFLITELHIWMCMVRVMSEGLEGKKVRNEMLKALWKDANTRAQKIGGLSGSDRKDQMLDLNEQFMATLFLYDEGLLSSDVVLAGALWRRFFERNCDDALTLETLVHYVRQQTLHLETFSREDVLLNGSIYWIPVADIN